jgi:hypothetical protein
VSAINLSGDNLACKSEQLSINTYEYTGASYQWAIKNQAGVAQTIAANGSNVTATIGAMGIYDVELTIYFAAGAGSVSRTFVDYLEVADCTPLPSTQANWYFGKYAGLRFTTSGVIRDIRPTRSTSKTQIHTNEGSISMSDSSGALLFYGAPDTTKNGVVSFQNFRLFDNAYNSISTTGLYGNHTASQGAFILPIDDAQKYYIFHSNYGRQFGADASTPFYSVLNLNTKTITKQNTQMGAGYYTEAISALPKCGDSTFWVVLCKYNTSIQTQYELYEVTKDTVRYDNTYTFSHNTNSGDMLKFSPDGTHFTHSRALYSFNRQTGGISLKHHEGSSKIVNAYSASFSPDSKKLYRFLVDTSLAKDASLIYQYDLEYSDIANSRRVVNASEEFNAMMLGPDSMIYLSGYQRPYVSRIEQPNKRISVDGNECELVIGAVALSQNGIGGVGTLSFPNNMEGLPDIAVTPDYRYAVDDCSIVTFESNQCCAASYLWNFGDGSTSTLRNPTHTYASSGTFTVSITTDGETASKSIELNISTSSLSIDGNTSFCDSTQIYDYEVSDANLLNINPDFTYTWSTTSGQVVYGDNKYQAGVLWKTSDVLSVLIKNEKDECEATLSLTVTKEIGEIINNVIDTSQVVCSKELIQHLTSQEARSDVSYQWYERVPGRTDWKAIIGKVQSDYIPNGDSIFTTYIDSTIINVDSTSYDTVTLSVKEYMLVASKGCTIAESNIAKVRVVALENTAIPNLGKCRDLGAIGSIEDYFGLNQNFQWEISDKSKDGVYSNWHSNKHNNLTDTNFLIGQVISGSASLFHYGIKDYGFKVRRITNFDICSDTSNEVVINKGFWIKEIRDTSICGNVNEVLITGEFNNDVNYKVRGIWVDGTTVIKDSVYETNSIGLKIPINGNSSKSIRLELKTNQYDSSSDRCTFGYLSTSRNIKIKTSLSVPVITQHPSNKVLSVGQLANFDVKVSSNTANSYLWEMCNNSQDKWSKTNYNTREIRISNLEECQNGIKLRCKISNPCGSVTSNYGTLTINGASTASGADVWMMDGTLDIGDEPNYAANTTNMQAQLFNSPDIWNRKSRPVGADYIKDNENPEYRIDSFNFLHYTVRNRGSVTTDPEDLYLYWTWGSTAEIWDKHWINRAGNRFYNEDSAKYYPIGSRINTTPIIIPSIAPGDSFTYYASWSPPNPEWYYTYVDGVKTYPSSTKGLSLCVLARIQECNQYPYGMTIAEHMDTLVRVNVKNNNNIVTRNLRVQNEKPGNQFVGRGGWTLLPTNCYNPEVITLKVNATEEFLDYYDVLLTIDDEFKLGINPNNLDGLYNISANQFIITDSISEISGIQLDTCARAMYKLDFLPKLLMEDIPKKRFEIAASQYSGGTTPPSGVMVFQVDNKTWFENQTGGQNNEGPTYDLWLSPNPTPNGFTVQLEDDAKAIYQGISGSIMVADGYGYSHIELENIDASSVTFINLSGYKAGVYNVRFEIGGNVFYKYVVKTDE